MNNIVFICKDGIKRLFKNAISTIIVAGLMLLPSIFAWYNILACWDVFNNTGSLTVAVANDDEGYRSDLVPVKVNVGEQIVSSLRANSDFNWVFTSSEDAIEGTKEGRYYAAVVISAGFSENMLSLNFLNGDAANIVYYSNEKKNIIAPTLTGQGADAIARQVNSLFAQTVTEVAVGMAQALSNELLPDGDTSRIVSLANNISAVSVRLQQTSQALELYGSLLESAQSLTRESADLIREVQDFVEETSQISTDSAQKISESVEKISVSTEGLQRALDTCEEGAQKVLNLAKEVGDEQAIASAQKVLDDIASLRDSVSQIAELSVANLRSDAESLKSSVAVLSSSLGVISTGLPDSIDGVAEELGYAATEMDTTASSLQSAALRLSTLAHDITVALASGDAAVLEELLGTQAEDLAAELTSPVAINRIALFSSDGFGSSMSPFYSVLALFIGQLLIAISLKRRPAKETLDMCTKLKDAQIYLGHFGVTAFITILQSLLLALGNIVFLQVQVTHPAGYILGFVVTGLVFAAMVYTLAVLLANLGKAIGVLLLIAQVTACGGSYPLELLPGFVQFISPWLPATHAVSAMRAAMMGIYQGDFWISLGILMLYALVFILLGVFLGKYIQKLSDAYLEKVEACKLMN